MNTSGRNEISEQVKQLDEIIERLGNCYSQESCVCYDQIPLLCAQVRTLLTRLEAAENDCGICYTSEEGTMTIHAQCRKHNKKLIV